MDTEEQVTRDSDSPGSTGGGICLLLLIIVGIAATQTSRDLTPIIATILAASFLYFIYYLIHTDQHIEIIGGIVLSIILMGVAAVIPFIGPILLVLWILYNIGMSIQGIKNLLPDATWSLFLWGSLIMPTVHGYESYYMFWYGSYFVLAFLYSGWLINQNLDTRTSLFKMSVMWMSIPIIALLVVSIISSLRSAFNVKTVMRSSVIKTPQQVSSHFRGDTLVQAYTRQIDQTITTAATTILPGSGAITSSIVNSMTHATNATGKSLVDSPAFSSNKSINFYRFDDLDNKKITNFINSINGISNFPAISTDDVIFYFDDTLFGKGDQGVIMTPEYIIYNGGKFDEPFHVAIKNIVDTSISGTLNKTIKLKTMSGTTHKMELTQSNKGAEIFHQALNEAIS